MKLGNISQTIVPVPNFFMDTTKDIDAFKVYYENKNNKKRIKRCHSYFSKSDLLSSNLDININNNPRVTNQKFYDLNKELYVPIYQKLKTPSNFEVKNTKFPDFKNTKNKEISCKIKEYLNFKKTKINKKMNEDIRKEILNNTYNLIERINSNYDLTKYTNFDSRTTFNKHFQTGYSRLTDAIKKTYSEKDLFKKALKEKAHSLKSINSKTKDFIKNNSYGNHLCIIDKGINIDQEEKKNSIDQILNNCQNNLLKLQYNNKEPFIYNKKDRDFIKDNKFLTSRINRTNLYKDFPSKTRIEFNMKKIIIPKKLMKYFGKSNYLTKEKYGMGKDELVNIQNEMWTRPLHHDAYKLYD